MLEKARAVLQEVFAAVEEMIRADVRRRLRERKLAAAHGAPLRSKPRPGLRSHDPPVASVTVPTDPPSRPAPLEAELAASEATATVSAPVPLEVVAPAEALREATLGEDEELGVEAHVVTEPEALLASAGAGYPRRTAGVIKWFDRGRGYGFVRFHDGQDAFVHQSALAASMPYQPRKGVSVSYASTPAHRGLQALDVRPAADTLDHRKA